MNKLTDQGPECDMPHVTMTPVSRVMRDTTLPPLSSSVIAHILHWEDETREYNLLNTTPGIQRQTTVHCISRGLLRIKSLWPCLVTREVYGPRAISIKKSLSGSDWAFASYWTLHEIWRWPQLRDEALSVVTRQLHFVKSSFFKHFNILKRHLLWQKCISAEKLQNSVWVEQKCPISFKPCSDLMLGVTLRAPPLNTPKSILLPFTLTSWGSFLRAKAVRISNNSHYIQANRHPSHRTTSGKCVLSLCLQDRHKWGPREDITPSILTRYSHIEAISQGLCHFTSP